MKMGSKIFDRVIALLLIFLITIGMMPMNISFVSAADIEQNQADIYTITVLDSHNKPIEGATVSYSINIRQSAVADPGDVLKTVTTDSNGTAVISDSKNKIITAVTDKIYTTVSKTGYETIEKNYSAKTANQNIKIKLTQKEKVNVTFVVRSDDLAKTLISNAEIVVGGYSNVTGTTANGRFECELYKDAVYQYKVTMAGYHSEEMANVSYDMDNEVSILLKPKMHDDTFKFDNSESVIISYGESYINAASSSKERPQEEILYTVTSDENVVSVNQHTGEVTTLGSGTATICATIPESEDYCEEKIYYTINVRKAVKTITFDTPNPANIKYAQGLKYNNPIVGGENITYDIINTKVNGNDVASINRQTGELTIKKSGKVDVKASQPANLQYNSASAKYSLTIDKAEQNSFEFEDPMPEDVRVINKEFINKAIGGSGSGAVSYKVVEGTDCAEFKDKYSPVLTLKKTGYVKVVAEKAEDDCYNIIQAQYTITIVKAENSSITFKTTNPEIIYEPGLKYNNELVNVSDGQKVTYSLVTDDEYPSDEFASIDENTGELKIKKASVDKQIKVKAVCTENDYYKGTVVYYYLKIKKAAQTDFAFVDGAEVEKKWIEDNNKYTNKAEGSLCDGAVSYSIVSVEELSDGTYCADLNTETGEITMNGKGKITVRAHKDGDENYDPADIEFTLIIKRNNQNQLYFPQSVSKEITYNSNGNVIQLTVEGGSGTGAVIYSLASGDAVTIRNEDSTAIISKAGNVEIVAVKAATDTYEEASASIIINIDKAEQEIRFADHETVTVVYGQSFVNTAYEVAYPDLPDHKGYAAQQPIVYEIVEGNEIASITSTGELVFNDEMVGKIHVKATKDGDDCYKPTTDEYIINVVYATIPDNAYTITGDKKNSSGWYTNDIMIIPCDGYEISLNRKLKNNIWSDSIVISEEGDTSRNVYLKKDNSISAAIEIPGEQLMLDKSAPHDLKIEYSRSVVDLMLKKMIDSLPDEEAQHFSFFKEFVTVTISAQDDISHISKFKYSYGTNIGEISKKDIKYTDDGITATAKILISAQFKGEFSFVAEDNAGNITTKVGDQVIVVDNIAPGVTVSYTNNDAENEIYYSKTRTATISISEENFFVQALDKQPSSDEAKAEVKRHLTVRTQRTDDDGNTFNEINKFESGFQYDEESAAWKATVAFKKNGRYKFSVRYSDYSGNRAENYNSEFVIDTIKPVIGIVYKNNEEKYDNCYNAAREAELTITDSNFSAKNVSFSEFVATDISGNPLKLEYDYIAEIKKEENWKHNGNDHTIKLPFDENARYSYKIVCTDLAGNEQKKSVADDFVVETAAPYDLSVSYSSPITEASLNDHISNKKSIFGFYFDFVVVTISAKDRFSGIHHFNYSCVDEVGSNSGDSGSSDDVCELNDITYTDDGMTATAQFVIPMQFRGSVSFTATNRAGNESDPFNDEKVIIVDTITPGVNVRYNNESVHNEKYYQSARTATISISEDNFFNEALEPIDTMEGLIDEHLIIKVKREDPSGYIYEKQLTTKDIQFTNVGDNIWEASINFTEDGNYQWSLEYKDFSGNTIDSALSYDFTIDTVKPELSIRYDNNAAQNENCYKNVRYAILTVKEHNFRSSDVVFDYFTAVDIQNNNADTPIVYSDIFKTAVWTRDANDKDMYSVSIPFTTDAKYDFNISYSDLAGNVCKQAVTDSFIVDTIKPAADKMKVSYSTSAVDLVFETLSFGFYRAPVKVELSAEDDTSGIDSFTYSYSVAANESSDNIGKENVIVNKKDIKYFDNGRRAECVFEIEAQYRGQIEFSVTDRSGNTSDTKMENKTLVVDSKPPVVRVSYDNNTVRNDHYYNSERTATITIDEANFFPESFDPQIDMNTLQRIDSCLMITVTKEDNNGKVETRALKNKDLTSPFKKEKSKGDIWTATLLFDEDGDYTWSVNYKDFSGNIANGFSDSFTVDKTDPEITVNYDNNDAKNSNYFNKNRTVTIAVTEHNFNARNMSVKVSTKQNVGSVDNYGAYFADPKNWTTVGNVHTAKATFSTEAYYTLGVSCIDLSGRTNKAVDFGNSTAPENFVIDKTAPKQLDIKINNESVVSQNGVSFERFYNKQIEVILSANCDIAGLDNLTYQKLHTATEYSENGRWIPYHESITIDPNEKFVIFFRAEDKAGNATIVNSLGIIVDDKVPVGQRFAPNIDIIPDAPNENGLHNSDVGVKINVVDPTYNGSVQSDDGFYSGLNRISYRIYTKDTNASQDGVLFDLAGSRTIGGTKDDDGLFRKWSGNITIPAATFNSNNIVVEVTASDNAGNSRVTTNENEKVKQPIKIDITPPSISITYDNNDGDRQFADSSRDAFFNKSRIARIIITERNFDSNNVKINARNTSNNSSVSVANWTNQNGNGNHDSDIHVGELNYSDDGDYVFSIEYADLAGNKNTDVNYNSSLAPTKFTVDQSPPKITVNYNNNMAENSNYYNAEREATITITEHNFEESRVKISVFGKDGNRSIIPEQSPNWTNNGDVHTMNIKYIEDAKYSFDIEYSDKAGNASKERPSAEFVIDKTEPEVSITEITDKSANNSKNGKIGYKIIATDTNFDEFEPELTAVVRTDKGFEVKTLDIGKMETIENGKMYVVDNLNDDGIYKIGCHVKDKAGNVFKKVELSRENGDKYFKDRSGNDSLVTFSVNRKGSTYELPENTKQIIKNYYLQNVAEDVVLFEINADKLVEYKVTVNDKTLSEENYVVNEVSNSGSWHRYEYKINKNVFSNEGEYKIVVSSTDKADNIAFNDRKKVEVEFIVDRTPPKISVTGIEENGRYQTDKQEVTLTAEDLGGEVNMLKVSLVDMNGADNEVLVDLAGEELTKLMNDGGNKITFFVGEGLYQNVRIICDDKANYFGNQNIYYDETIHNVSVTTNSFLIFWANKPLRWASIIGIVAVISLVVFLIIRASRKKKQK